MNSELPSKERTGLLSALGFTMRGDGSFKSNCRVTLRLTDSEGENGEPNGEIFYRVEIRTDKGALWFLVHENDFIVEKVEKVGQPTWATAES